MDQQSNTRAGTGEPMSLEASLDKENKEVLAALSKTQSDITTPPRTGTPPPPFRSMLDVDYPSGPATIRHGSIAGIGVGVTDPRHNPRAQRRPSRRLDPSDPSTWTTPHTKSAQTSRSSVQEAHKFQQGLPRIEIEDGDNFETKYKFDMSAMPTSFPAPRKSSQGTALHIGHGSTDATAHAVTTTAPLGDEFSGPDSKLKANQQKPLSVDVKKKTVATPPTSPPPPVLLSPERAIHSPSSPEDSRRPRRDSNRSDTSERSNSFSSVSEGSASRLRKDVEGDDEFASGIESDEDVRSSESESGSPQVSRGRSRAKSPSPPPRSADPDEKSLGSPYAPQSKGVKSLLDPVASPSRPDSSVSSFGRSGPTAADFEDDDDDPEADIQKAKNMGVLMSDVDSSIADRHVRMVIRGDWARLQEHADETNHTSRLYLACTDLSTEAQYAMEWTVGTMLRDGDTLLAIYAIEDETAPKEVEGNREVLLESKQAAHDAGETMASLTRQTTGLSQNSAVTKSRFTPVTEAPPSIDTKASSKKETERLQAMDQIMQTFLKLVRKTTLQVRCMVEVIHCKSPRHLILNAIDELDPTLCVVGTRGRSSLKGVLLGSFSNYLVTKSSVPVMVARKRLKKPRHAKVNSSSIRLSNNLTNTIIPRGRKSLTQARID